MFPVLAPSSTGGWIATDLSYDLLSFVHFHNVPNCFNQIEITDVASFFSAESAPVFERYLELKSDKGPPMILSPALERICMDQPYSMAPKKQAVDHQVLLPQHLLVILLPGIGTLAALLGNAFITWLVVTGGLLLLPISSWKAGGHGEQEVVEDYCLLLPRVI